VPSICAQDQITDWFDSLAECLHWNVRKKQRHLDELSDLTRMFDTLFLIKI
jgi:NAD+ kinase